MQRLAKVEDNRPTIAPAIVPDDSETREITGEFSRMVQEYLENYKVSSQEAFGQVSTPKADVQIRVINAPPTEIRWYDLDRLATHSPVVAQQKWEES